MKANVDKGRRPIKIKFFHQMLLNIDGYHFNPTSRTSKILTRRYDGQYKVLACIGKIEYRLELLEHMHLDLVFHVNQLRPFVIYVYEPRQALPTHPPTSVIDRLSKTMAKIKYM